VGIRTSGAIGLACLLAAAGSLPAASQEENRLGFFLTESIGYEVETDEPGALAARELLSASMGSLSGSVDISSAIGIAPGNYNALIDSAGLHFAYRFSDLEEATISFDSHLRYRELFEDAWELRYGATVKGFWGPGLAERGIFGDWAMGFEGISTVIGALSVPLTDGNPLFRFDAGWRFSSLWAADAAIESFSDEAAAYFPKALFDFGASLQLSSLTLQCRLMIKYADFFTPTGYLDGFALRMTAKIPLKGA
jgi:hypothetical protein